MTINRNNYEAFFLDYRENNLTPEQVAELLVFLEQNPDLKDEFESFETIQMMPDKNIRFELKESLKKNNLIATDNIDAGNYDTYMVADLEGDLSEEESLELKAFISLNPKTKLEYNIFRSTFLKPEKAIQFRDKERLKKTGLFVLYRTQLYYSVAIAASVIILLGVYFRFLKQPEEQKNIVFIEKQEVTPSKIDSHSPAVTPLNPPLKKEERSLAQNPDHVKIKNSIVEPDRNMTANYRMKAITGSTIKTDEINGFTLADYRNTEPTFSIVALDIPAQDIEPQKSFVSRFIGGLAGKVIKTDNLRGKSFLDFTVEGYNLMADKDVEIEKEVDENGKVIAYSLDGQNLSFFRNRGQQKE